MCAFTLPPVPKVAEHASAGAFNPFSHAGETTTFHFGTGKTFTSSASPETPFAEKIEHVSVLEIPEYDPSQFRTGEEEDEIILDLHANLYRLRVDSDSGDKGYTERGSGSIHLNKSSGFYRVAMRQQGSGCVILNTRVFKKTDPRVTNGRYVRFLACAGESGELSVMLARFDTKDDAEKFAAALSEAAAGCDE